jgi:formate hydrogenlyase subunit 4
LKLFAFAALIVHLAVPLATGNPFLDWPVFITGTLAVAVVIGVVESTMARLPLPYIPILLAAACLLSAFGIILLVR